VVPKWPLVLKKTLHGNLPFCCLQIVVKMTWGLHVRGHQDRSYPMDGEVKDANTIRQIKLINVHLQMIEAGRAQGM